MPCVTYILDPTQNFIKTIVGDLPMKYNCLIFAALLAATQHMPLCGNQENLCIQGSLIIQGLSSAHRYEQYQVFYDGKKTTVSADGLFKIPLDEKIEHPSLLIGKIATRHNEGSLTPECFFVPKTETYKYFIHKKDDEWIESSLAENRIVPEHTVIIYMNPAHIEKLQPWPLRLAANFIKLPQIVLRSDLSKQDITRSAAEYSAFACDIANYHEPIRTA